MCSHVESIDDFTSGDVLCLNCGLVLDKIYISSTVENLDSKENTDFAMICRNNSREKDIREGVIDFINRTNIHSSFSEDITNNAIKVLSRFSHFPSILVIASACFVTLSKTKYPITLTKIENIVCENKRDKKNLFKMIVSLYQPGIYPNLSLHVANSALQGLELKFQDIESIKKNIFQLKCEYCTYSPLTVVGGHTILYFEDKQTLTFSSICFHIGVSKTAIYAYINPQRHKCLNNWKDVYKQLSSR